MKTVYMKVVNKTNVLCEIPLTVVECISSSVETCLLPPAFSYKGPTLCPGALSEPVYTDQG